MSESSVDKCKTCTHRNAETDHGSADVICTDCAQVIATWSPEHPANAVVFRPVYERNGYFDVVVHNILGYDCRRFTMRDLARIRRYAPEERDWDVGKVRAITRRLKMKGLTKTAGRMAHALKYGVQAPYPRLHHVERESMRRNFAFVESCFEAMTDKKRKNLISYAFVIGKLLEIVGRAEDFRHLIVPIKTKSKLRFANRIWARIEEGAPWNQHIERKDNKSAKDYVASQEYIKLGGARSHST